ncbi:MAG: AAA family ATPase [Gallionellaceae bacterium]
MKPLRIGIAGTHSTGKTTFCNLAVKALTEKGLRVARVKSFGSDAVNAHIKMLRDHDEDSTLWFITRTISAEIEASVDADVVLIDRPVPDALGYWMAALEYRSESPNSAEKAMIENLVKEYTSTYSLLLATVLDTSIPLGEGRDNDLVFRQLAAKNILATLRHMGTPFIPLEPKNVNSAVEQIVSMALNRGLGEIVC